MYDRGLDGVTTSILAQQNQGLSLHTC
jgi:hypothetical protein